ncbi:uncharacterized protein GGS22DRAFT_196774 [Annulohypoxylon maeteangense]|uniref:uncharacterized protein n=1 Tax=Annulohypoxylon maeteangense TaxID=1927788 RepID=UPI0020074CF3|nr:uncharacterized protein GGS22DRAFT_196774 [Annulohypoxylon maeteangense]KAI0889096.1 hypothetical protein GGS22DRAFT_196774 [Annulohypoxylon maeteangense]
MGWLNFLSRKSPVSNLDDGLKAQAYDETVAANPPIRGTYPVAGNGASILEKFQKSHPHLRDTNFNASPLPHPALPPFLERPNTAPAHRSPEGSARPKSQSASSVKPLPPPPKKRHGPYKLPSKLPDERNDEITNKSIYSVPSPTFTRNRNSSILSTDSSSTRRFVDLLDAHSFIKPSDFYGRVKATGAKDYGEDVADRNIRESRSSINPTQADEIFAKNFAFGAHDDSKDVNRPPSSRKRHSVGSGLRTKSISSNFHSTLPVIASPELPQESEDTSVAEPVRKTPRRKSLHSYIPPSSAERCAERPRSASLTKRGERIELNYFPDSLRERARAVAQEGFEHDISMNLSQVVNSIRPLRDAYEAPPYKQDSDDDVYHDCHDYRQDPLTQMDQYRSVKSSSGHRSTSNVSSLTAFKHPSKSGSLQTSQSSNRRGSIIQSSLPGVEEDLHVQKNRKSSRHEYGAKFDIHDSFYEFSSSNIVEPSASKLTYSRPNSRDEQNYRDRNRSVVSVSAKSMKHSGTGDVVPERGSSIRRWSLTSETGGSTQSSNPFRPQSGHTTNTSVDLTPRVPLPKTIESHQTSPLSESNHVISENQSEIDTQEPLYHEVDPELLAGSSRRQRSMDFVIDEDASSIDSFDNPQHSAGEFEKDLLFQGYGFGGFQLPGLPGLFDAGVSKPRKKLSQRTHSFSAGRDSHHLTAPDPDFDILPLGSRYSTRSLKYTSRPRSSRLPMPDFSDSDSEFDDGSEVQYESEEDINFDIPRTRSIESRRQSYSSRRRYEMTTESLRGSDTVFPDISRVAHLRRETKTNQRVSTGSLRKAKGKGKATDIGIPRIGLDDPSNYADVE